MLERFALFDSMVSVTFTAMVMPRGCLRLNGYIWIDFQLQGLKKLMGHKMSPAQSCLIPDRMSNC